MTEKHRSMSDSKEAKLKEIRETRRRLRDEVRSEYRKQTLAGITTALALVIALAWQDTIKLAAQSVLTFLGISSDGIISKLIGAIIITVLAATALVILSRWANKLSSKEK